MRIFGTILFALAIVQQGRAVMRISPTVGESNEAAIINCRCAQLVNSNMADADPTCDNFRKLYLNAIMTPSSVTQGQAPGQVPAQQGQQHTGQTYY